MLKTFFSLLPMLSDLLTIIDKAEKDKALTNALAYFSEEDSLPIPMLKTLFSLLPMVLSLSLTHNHRQGRKRQNIDKRSSLFV